MHVIPQLWLFKKLRTSIIDTSISTEQEYIHRSLDIDINLGIAPLVSHQQLEKARLLTCISSFQKKILRMLTA